MCAESRAEVIALFPILGGSIQSFNIGWYNFVFVVGFFFFFDLFSRLDIFLSISSLLRF